MATSKAQKAATAARRTQAIALRIAGMDWQTIADRLGYSGRGAACKDVSRAMVKHQQKEAEQVELLRHLTVQRYDRLQGAFWAAALKGDTKAAEIVLKCIAGRSRIEGTEAPNKLDVSGGVTYEIVGVDPADLV